MAAVEQVAHVPPGRADRDGGGPDPSAIRRRYAATAAGPAAATGPW